MAIKAEGIFKERRKIHQFRLTCSSPSSQSPLVVVLQGFVHFESRTAFEGK